MKKSVARWATEKNKYKFCFSTNLPALVTIISVPSWSNCCHSACISSSTFIPLTWGALMGDSVPLSMQGWCSDRSQFCGWSVWRNEKQLCGDHYTHSQTCYGERNHLPSITQMATRWAQTIPWVPSATGAVWTVRTGWLCPGASWFYTPWDPHWGLLCLPHPLQHS